MKKVWKFKAIGGVFLTQKVPLKVQEKRIKRKF